MLSCEQINNLREAYHVHSLFTYSLYIYSAQLEICYEKTLPHFFEN